MAKHIRCFIHFSLFLVILFSAVGCTVESGFILPDNSKIQYTGRIDNSDPKAPVLYWPGTYIKANFNGSSLKLILDDSRGDNYYNMFVDNNYDAPVIIDCEKGEHEYSVFSNLKDTTHSLLIFRRTEGFSGGTKFKGIILDKGKSLANPPKRPVRKIEFFGNSITCGMGNECPDEAGDNDNSKRNNFLAYGAMTARNIGAEYVCTAKSGIGIIISWFDFTMPDYYYRLDPSSPDSKWDFSKWTPDLVVINLFQNDSWLIKKMDPVPGEKEIVKAYYEFIKTIRGKYSDADIICTLGSMDATNEGQPWPDYIKKAVELFKEKNNDDKIYHLFFEFDGTVKHPRVRHHKEMADKLTQFIKDKLVSKQ